MICIVTHDEDDPSHLRLDLSGTINDLKLGHTMIVNTGDIDRTRMFSDDADFITSKSSVGTAVHERTSSIAFVIGDDNASDVNVKSVIVIAKFAWIKLNRRHGLSGWRGMTLYPVRAVNNSREDGL